MNGINILEKFGDAAQFALPVGIGLYALFSGRLMQGLALGLIGGMQHIEVLALKHFFSRPRPQPYYAGRVSHEDLESFPSGHTGGAFLAAGFSIGLFGGGSAATITVVALASLVALSRYLSCKHWPTDILAGAAIGLCNGLLAARLNS